MSKKISILIADDHALFRRGLVELLSEQPDFVVLGEASNGLEAAELNRQYNADVVLMDVNMPGVGGVEALYSIKRTSTSRVLMLTISTSDSDLLGAIKAGAGGYLLKSAEPEELCTAIRWIAAGKNYLSQEVTTVVMQAAVQKQENQGTEILSARELEILASMARGATNAEIATRLVISANTVKTHVRKILEKLNASNRAEAVARALDQGLLKSL